MTLRRRVLLGFLAVALALVATNVVLATSFERYLIDRTDEELVDTAGRPIFASVGRLPGGFTELEPLSDLYIAVASLDGTALSRLGRSLDEGQSPPAPTARQLAASAGEPFSAPSADGDGKWRIIAVGERVPNRLLVLATDLDQVESTLRRMQLIQVIGSAAVLVALAAVLWWVLRLGVRPLVEMAETAERIKGGDLSLRVEEVDDETEAGRMGSAFNSMLGRIEDAFAERDATEGRLRQFVADASHELRTPLTSIRGYAELWQAGGLRGEAELDQAMGRLSAEGRRMGTLVDDLLLLARLDQQRPVERAAVRLDQLAADAVVDARAVDLERPLTIDSSPVTVSGDELRLRQVVSNLLTNARVHTPPGTAVHVAVSSDGANGRLEVSDEGPGMSEQTASRVFERFYRGDSARSSSSGGSGLGLSIVDAIVRAHGGSVSVTSKLGEGTRFVVELPLSAPDPQDPHSNL